MTPPGPWRTRGWAGAVTLGPLAVITLALVAALLGWAPSPLTAATATHALIQKHMENGREQLQLLRVICLNTAPSEQARARCVE